MKHMKQAIQERWFDYIRIAISAYLLMAVATKELPRDRKIAILNAIVGLWAYQGDRDGTKKEKD